MPWPHVVERMNAHLKMNKNARTGLIILGCLLLLVIGISVSQMVAFGTMRFTVQFADAKGLEAGDAVYLKGVNIGDVKRVRITSNGVQADVSVRNDPPLPVDTVLFIWTDKLISGKKCIQAKLGDDKIMIQPGDIIVGESDLPIIWIRVGKKWLESL